MGRRRFKTQERGKLPRLEEWTEALGDQPKPQWSINIRKMKDWKGKPSGITFSQGNQGRLPWARLAEEECGVTGGEQDLYDVIFEQAIDFLRDAFDWLQAREAQEWPAPPPAQPADAVAAVATAPASISLAPAP